VCNKKLHNSYSSSNITITKSKRMRSVGDAIRMKGKTDAHVALMGKL
jgi:hypothetical protein